LSCDDELERKSNISYEPSPRLLKLLGTLSNDPKNLVFIVTGRERKYLSDWFSGKSKFTIGVPNLCLAAEHGFFYNYGNKDEWKELFCVKDWKWKDSVTKILEGFTEKTEGSYIVTKEAILSWYYKDCEVYFGHVQANEINTHLQNIFENCKLDIVNGKGYVEIKPRNVNKGFFVSHIIKNEFKERNCIPDFIFAIGDDTSDEEMFNYLNSVHNQLNFYNEVFHFLN
jgi:trehalose 6-phosphate synthase/phosphatase